MSVDIVTFKKADVAAKTVLDLKPLEWGIFSGWVYVRCPHETHERLGMIHEFGVANEKCWKIDEAGKVNPSIWWKDCGCDTHIYGILEGWVPFQGEIK